MIRAALMKWQEGRLKREEVKGVSLVLRYFSFIQDLFTVLWMKNLLWKKKSNPASINWTQAVVKPSKLRNCTHWFLPLKAMHLPSCGLCTSQNCLQICPPPPWPPLEKTPPVFPLHNITHSAQGAQLKSRQSYVPKQTAFMWNNNRASTQMRKCLPGSQQSPPETPGNKSVAGTFRIQGCNAAGANSISEH